MKLASLMELREEADVGIDGCGGIKLAVGLRACHFFLA